MVFGIKNTAFTVGSKCELSGEYPNTLSIIKIIINGRFWDAQ